MRPLGFRCTRCGHEVAEALSQRCPSCEGVLEPVYPESTAKRLRKLAQTRGNSIWVFRDVLPVSEKANVVSLGEGMTPLIQAYRMAEQIGVEQLWLKLEGMNPTGSFKDRGLSVSITYAMEHGASGVIGASSGNALHAQAAYAAIAGLLSVALVPESVPRERLIQPIVCGTKVAKVRGDYSQCHQLARSFGQQTGWYNVSTTYENPIVTEGYKTIAYEILQAMKRAPDWVVVPVGAGPLLGACARGFYELYEMGLVERVPALLGVQAQGCAPIAKAFAGGSEKVNAWERPIDTIARGIADPLRGYAQDGTYTLKWVRSSGGIVLEVDDVAIMKAVKDLGYLSGVYAEPTAAASIAGLRTAVDQGWVSRGARVVCLITGTGFKETAVFGNARYECEILDPEVSSILEWLSRG